MSLRFFISAVMSFALVACVRTAMQPAEPLEAGSNTPIPEGCEQTMNGLWHHQLEPRYRYEAIDDGGMLTLNVAVAPPRDAAFVPRRFRLDAGQTSRVPPSNAPMRVELARTPSGFVGHTFAPVMHPSGRTCEGLFPTTVISCDGGLLLKTQSFTTLGEACQMPPSATEPSSTTHFLMRSVPGGGDARGQTR